MRYGFMFTAATLLLLTGFTGCRQEPGFDKVPVHFVRFDRKLYALRGPALPDSLLLAGLRSRHNNMLDLYSRNIIRIGRPEAPEFRAELGLFLSDSSMNEAFHRVEQIFPDMNDAEVVLSDAFGRYKYWFPNKPIPRFYTIVSGFNESVVISDSLLAMALDKYLGREEPMYAQLGFPDFMTRTMSKEYLPGDCVRAWALSEFPINDSVDNVLSHIVYEGQIMYMVTRMLPDVADTLLFGYSAPQLEWCKKNESNMWARLSGQNLLFSTDYLIVRKLTGPAPFTSLFTAESPGRAAVWLGYRIVSSFVEHQKSSLPELMGMTDYRDILNRARFRPGGAQF